MDYHIFDGAVPRAERARSPEAARVDGDAKDLLWVDAFSTGSRLVGCSQPVTTREDAAHDHNKNKDGYCDNLRHAAPRRSVCILYSLSQWPIKRASLIFEINTQSLAARQLQRRRDALPFADLRNVIREGQEFSGGLRPVRTNSRWGGLCSTKIEQRLTNPACLWRAPQHSSSTRRSHSPASAARRACASICALSLRGLLPLRFVHLKRKFDHLRGRDQRKPGEQAKGRDSPTNRPLRTGRGAPLAAATGPCT